MSEPTTRDEEFGRQLAEAGADFVMPEGFGESVLAAADGTGRRRAATATEAPELLRPRRSPWLPIAAICAVLAIFVAVDQYTERKDAQAKLARERADRQALEEKIGQLTNDIDKLIAEKDGEVTRLLAAKSEQEKSAAQAALDQKNAMLAKKREQLAMARKAAAKSAARKKMQRDRKALKAKCDPNDPLCGI